MFVKDWLSVVSNAQNIKVVDGNTSAYGTKESIEENYGDFELKKVEQVNDTDLLILYVSTKCPYYRVRTVKHYLSEYERGVYFGYYGVRKEYIEKDEPYCMGTRELESCNCGGNKKKCNHCD